jgi:hypothetical protein
LLYSGDIGTKIYSSITDFLSCFDELWYWRIRDLEISQILVILHKDIVLGSEMLDEIGLEYECLDLSLTGDDLDICDLPDHLPLGHREIIRLDEV